MSDFLANIAARSAGLPPQVMPRAAARFEEPADPAPLGFEEIVTEIPAAPSPARPLGDHRSALGVGSPHPGTLPGTAGTAAEPGLETGPAPVPPRDASPPRSAGQRNDDAPVIVAEPRTDTADGDQPVNWQRGRTPPQASPDGDAGPARDVRPPAAAAPRSALSQPETRAARRDVATPAPGEDAAGPRPRPIPDATTRSDLPERRIPPALPTATPDPPAREPDRPTSRPEPPVAIPIIARLQPYPEPEPLAGAARAVPAAPEPAIHVTIGRVEVRGLAPPPQPRRASTPPPGMLPLNEYLARRRRGD